MRKTLFFLILTLLFLGSCASKINNTDNQQNIIGPLEDNEEVSSNKELTEIKDSISFYDIRFDISFNDKYGNLLNQYYFRKRIDYSIIKDAPDIDLLSQISKRLFALTINNKQLTDISFLKDLPQLKELYILESNISSLEPIKYLENLETLHIEKGYPGIIDCTIFMNLKKLKIMKIGENKIENMGALYKFYQGFSRRESPDLRGVTGFFEYYKKYESLWDSYSYVFHYDKNRVFQQGVKIRAKPSEKSGIVAEINFHDEFQIIENTEIEEELNNIWGYWYKIKYNNDTGYLFGGYIPIDTLITDIDKNGIKDYFFLIQTTETRYIDPDKDIIIYINDQKIDTSVLSTTERTFESKLFESCIFEEGDGDVLIGLMQYGRHQYEYWHIFKVLPNGKIEYVKNWDEIDYW
jgi:hypothetical protein